MSDQARHAAALEALMSSDGTPAEMLRCASDYVDGQDDASAAAAAAVQVLQARGAAAPAPAPEPAEPAVRSLRIEEIRAGLQSAEARRAVARFEARCGKFGEVERRQSGVIERADSGNPDTKGGFIVRGHAAVYGKKSLDLGGFQEVIDKGAFTSVLDRAPHVVLVRDHEPGTELASTLAPGPEGYLELREDPAGLHFYSKVPDLGDLTTKTRRQMEHGLVNQASFAFTVESDTWEIRNPDTPEEMVLRTIHQVGDLYDVTITSQGAYPQTDSSVVRSLAVAYASEHGRLPDEEGARTEEAAAETPDPEVTPSPVASEESAEGGDKRKVNQKLLDLRFRARQVTDLHRHEIGARDGS